MQVRVKPGKHPYIPANYKLWPMYVMNRVIRWFSGLIGLNKLMSKQGGWHIILPKGSWYSANDVEDGDHKDWNKLFGYGYRLFRSRRKSLMWAFRPHPDMPGWMQITPYFHDDEGRAYFPTRYNGTLTTYPEGATVTAPVASVREDKPFFIAIYPQEIDGEFLFFIHTRSAGSQLFLAKIPGVRKSQVVRWIFPWFGGNKPAPDTMYVYFWPTEYWSRAEVNGKMLMIDSKIID